MKEVKFIKDTRSNYLTNEVNNMKEKDIILIENTRFEDVNGSLESKNNEELAKYWASLGDVFINDAFGTLHRAHASNVGIASFCCRFSCGKRTCYARYLRKYSR